MKAVRTITPTPDIAHAAFVACRAAMLARDNGADDAQAQAEYDRAYREALRLAA